MQLSRLRRSLLPLLLGLCFVGAGGQDAAARGVPAVASTLAISSQSAIAGQAPAAALYDLEADERLGGHTIARHVGRSDRDLAERLRREPQIAAASTYTDLITARRVVAAALAQARRRVDTWAQRSGPRPNLVVNYAGAAGHAVGRSLRRGEPASTAATRALIVLRWLPREQRWIVLTSYPEAR